MTLPGDEQAFLCHALAQLAPDVREVFTARMVEHLQALADPGAGDVDRALRAALVGLWTPPDITDGGGRTGTARRRGLTGLEAGGEVGRALNCSHESGPRIGPQISETGLDSSGTAKVKVSREGSDKTGLSGTIWYSLVYSL